MSTVMSHVTHYNYIMYYFEATIIITGITNEEYLFLIMLFI